MNNLTANEIAVLKHLVKEKIDTFNLQTSPTLISQYNTLFERLKPAAPSEHNIDLIYTYVECLQEVIRSTEHKIMMDELGDINDYIGLIKDELKSKTI